MLQIMVMNNGRQGRAQGGLQAVRAQLEAWCVHSCGRVMVYEVYELYEQSR